MHFIKEIYWWALSHPITKKMNLWVDTTQLIVLLREADALQVSASLSSRPCQGAEEGAMVGW